MPSLIGTIEEYELYRRWGSRSLTTICQDIRREHHPPTLHACELPSRQRSRRLPRPSLRRPRMRSLPRATRRHSPSPHPRRWTFPANPGLPARTRFRSIRCECHRIRTLWLFSRICFLSTLTVFAPIVFLPTAFVFTAAFFGAGFLVNFFLGIPLFLLASFFLGATFLPAVLVAFEGFCLAFFWQTYAQSTTATRHEAARRCRYRRPVSSAFRWALTPL